MKDNHQLIVNQLIVQKHLIIIHHTINVHINHLNNFKEDLHFYHKRNKSVFNQISFNNIHFNTYQNNNFHLCMIHHQREIST